MFLFVCCFCVCSFLSKTNLPISASKEVHVSVEKKKEVKKKKELFSHLNLRCFSFSSSEKVRKRMPAADSQPAADLQHARDGVAQSDGHLEIHDDTSFPNKSEQQPKENSPMPGTWSPLLTKVCLCTALALSAFACYRAYFH